ncbi:hypothetical protein FQN52_002554 [Onygenales sp. PD_12]|nr:hypothetical protein FQN52_002554 [Onygenales sp. PD_12]
MQFAAVLFTLGLALTSTFAEPIPKPKRQVSEYKNIVTGIATQVNVVDGLVTSYIGGTVPGTDVQEGNDVLVALINDGATTITGLEPLNTLEVLDLVGDLQDLIGTITTVVDNIIAAEPNFVADGLNDEVLTGLVALQGGAENLRAAVIPKIPEALQGTADELAAEIVADLQRAVDAYSD